MNFYNVLLQNFSLGYYYLYRIPVNDMKSYEVIPLINYLNVIVQ